MTKFEELQKELMEGIKAFVTADNTESVSKLSEIVKKMGEEHSTTASENIKLKDKIVDVVKSSMFTEKPQENIN